MDTILKAYIECAVWSSYTNDETPLDQVDFVLSQQAKDRMKADCERFTEQAHDLITAKSGDWSRAGHDFWLTRNGHGSGFWDRPEVWGEVEAKALTDLAHGFGECYLYVGDDDLIYCAPE